MVCLKLPTLHAWQAMPWLVVKGSAPKFCYCNGTLCTFAPISSSIGHTWSKLWVASVWMGVKSIHSLHSVLGCPFLSLSTIETHFTSWAKYLQFCCPWKGSTRFTTLKVLRWACNAFRACRARVATCGAKQWVFDIFKLQLHQLQMTKAGQGLKTRLGMTEQSRQAMQC